jgi:hypothetical protein
MDTGLKDTAPMVCAGELICYKGTANSPYRLMNCKF